MKRQTGGDCGSRSRRGRELTWLDVEWEHLADNALHGYRHRDCNFFLERLLLLSNLARIHVEQQLDLCALIRNLRRLAGCSRIAALLPLVSPGRLLQSQGLANKLEHGWREGKSISSRPFKCLEASLTRLR